MKKMILTMFAMMFMTTVFAENENTNVVNNLDAYTLNVNMNRLAVALELCDDQRDAVEHIQHNFAAELLFAATSGKNDRKAMIDRAVNNNVKWMRYVLNDKQMHTYLLLLNTTLNNRGLNK